ncbi:glutamate racemase [Candidatus Parcubacteria bacterium]|nr:glutamate racemase [Patescibacteria group bacterium]MCG2694114.1 glutamate racemase [Candidatus Parcubacteria bacterium]
MIGIFDSGVGGLTVVRELRKTLPEYDLIYFGDTARTPYGNKSKETIIKYALEDADFLIKRGARVLVVACNTVSALGIEALRKKYPEMPIFEVITPAVGKAVELSKNKRIGIIGTRATIGSGIYEEKITEKGKFQITSQACPLFVPFIEEGWIRQRELKMIAKRYLSQFRNFNIDVLILGCTHYPIIKDIIQMKTGRRVKLIDSAESIAQEIKNFLKDNDLKLSKTGKLEIFVSDKTTQCQKIADKVLGTSTIQQV